MVTNFGATTWPSYMMNLSYNEMCYKWTTLVLYPYRMRWPNCLVFRKTVEIGPLKS